MRIFSFGFIAFVISLVIFLAISFSVAGCSSTHDPEVPRLSENWDATVYIRVGNRGHGTGIVVSHCGHIITNDHVVEAAQGDQLMVSFDNQGINEYEAHVVDRDSEHDLAVIQASIMIRNPAVVAIDDTVLLPGDETYSIGFPLGFGKMMSRGSVRAVSFSLDSPNAPPAAQDVFLLGQQQEPGTSGSGVFDVQSGQMIGVMSMVMWGGFDIFRMESTPLIIPVRYVRHLLDTNGITYCRPPPPLHERIRNKFIEWFVR